MSTADTRRANRDSEGSENLNTAHPRPHARLSDVYLDRRRHSQYDQADLDLDDDNIPLSVIYSALRLRSARHDASTSYLKSESMPSLGLPRKNTSRTTTAVTPSSPTSPASSRDLNIRPLEYHRTKGMSRSESEVRSRPFGQRIANAQGRTGRVISELGGGGEKREVGDWAGVGKVGRGGARVGTTARVLVRL